MDQQDPHLAQPNPPQPSKKSCGRNVGLGCAGIITLIILIAIIANIGGGSSKKSNSSSQTPGTQSAQPSSAIADTSTPTSQSLAQDFKDYVNKHGSANEKEAAGHVTKIQGANRENDILDTAEVYTDYSGGLTGPDAGNGKLIASTFADWQASRGKDSSNGLVTVYDKHGQILSTGQY